MKATELKVGDLVLYKGKHLITVEEAGYGLCSGSDENGIFHNRMPYEYVQPIPLTEEILEKNGWQKDDEEDWVIGISCAELILSFYQFGKEMVCSVSVKSGLDNAGLCDIKYAHQLQHLLWALSINDNLKI